MQRAVRPKERDGGVLLDELLPAGSWQRVAAGVVVAAGGGLLAAAMLGVGPAALAGTAGYLAYRGLKGERKGDGASEAHNHN